MPLGEGPGRPPWPAALSVVIESTDGRAAACPITPGAWARIAHGEASVALRAARRPDGRLAVDVEMAGRSQALRIDAEDSIEVAPGPTVRFEEKFEGRE